jgi:hypothetical protein
VSVFSVDRIGNPNQVGSDKALGIRSAHMNGLDGDSDRQLHADEASSPQTRSAKLAQLIETLEEGLRTLESLDLTLAAALLDHAIAETKRHQSD